MLLQLVVLLVAYFSTTRNSCQQRQQRKVVNNTRTILRLIPQDQEQQVQEELGTMLFPQGTTQLLAAVFVFQQANSIAADDVVSTPIVATTFIDEVADAGVLNATFASFLQEHQAIKDSSGTPAALASVSGSTTSTCTAGYIDCVNGFVKGSKGKISCETACAGKCCVGNSACNLFTGKVCKDGSCSGFWSACAYATIPKVVNSCHGRTWSCLNAGNKGNNGKVGSIINSCNDEYACNMLNSESDDVSAVGHIIDSCNGFSACRHAGTAMNIKSSCNDGFACYELGRSGAIGDVLNSCNGDKACMNVVVEVGSSVKPPLVNNCCNGDQACFVSNDDDDDDDYDDDCFDDGCFHDGAAAVGGSTKVGGSSTLPDECKLTSAVSRQYTILKMIYAHVFPTTKTCD